MSGRRRTRVPIGAEAAPWVTRGGLYDVLAVVHNVTSATRLLDVLPLLGSDPRLQFHFAWTKSSVFADGVREMMAELGVVEVPWKQAVRHPYRLAVSASYGGDLHRLRAPLLTVSHGTGYNKYFNRKAETERPKPKGRNREAPFGFGPEWLMHDGRVVPAAIVLSHAEQLDRLRLACPEAAEVAVVAGDPCYDRLLVSRSRRAQLRRDLGIAPGQRLVVLTSTWAEQSLLGERFDLVDRLLAELPVDDHRLAAIPHPNIWHLHGRFTVESWLAAHRRSGLIVPPPTEGWQALLIAADCVIGDHGSVTFYGAALGAPVLMGAFPHDAVDPGSPIAGFGAAVPRLDLGRPLRAQVEKVMAAHEPARYGPLTDKITSLPGQSGRVLRDLMYGLMGLDPPPAWTVPAPVRVRTLPTAPVTATWTSTTPRGGEFHVERRPAWLLPGTPPDGAHLVLDAAEPGLLDIADVIVERDPAGPADDCVRNLLACHDCLVAAAPCAPGHCLIGIRRPAASGPSPIEPGTLVEVALDGCDPAVAASVVHDLVATGHPADRPPAVLRVRVGPTMHRLTVRPHNA